MEKNLYAMSKLAALEAKEKPSRDCSFYVKYFFLFLSLIQFLIILGLVLFMLYGNPLGATEEHVRGLNVKLHNCTARGKSLDKDLTGLKRQLNASQAETRVVRVQVTGLNNSLRSCNNEKAKMQEIQKDNLLVRQITQDCIFNLHLLNLSCPVQISALQEQVRALEVRLKVDQDTFAQKAKVLQEKLHLSEEEKRNCQLEKLQTQTQGEKYQNLETKILSELEPARQKLVSAVDQALSTRQLASCYHSDIISMKDVCLGLSGNLQNHVNALGRQVDQRVNEVAQQNGLLEKQRATCAYNLQDRDRRLVAQQDQADRDKLVLREAHEAEVKKMLADQQKLIKEKDQMMDQLEQVKQSCFRMRMNLPLPASPALRYPGSAAGTNPVGSLPGSLGNPGGVALAPKLKSLPGSAWQGQPGSLPQGNPSIAIDRSRFPDLRKETPGGKLPNQPLLTPGGQPSG